MMWTEKTERALQRAARLHDGQYRKGGVRVPVITHPVAVAEIIAPYTSDEDVIAAALLHDTLEDTTYTEADLRAEFGDRVADMVLGVTIPETLEGEEGDWLRDRKRYIENLTHASDEAALIAAGDKLHNFRQIILQYQQNRDAFHADFGGLTKDRITVYAAVVAAIVSRVPEALARELQEAWGAYERFLAAA